MVHAGVHGVERILLLHGAIAPTSESHPPYRQATPAALGRPIIPAIASPLASQPAIRSIAPRTPKSRGYDHHSHDSPCDTNAAKKPSPVTNSTRCAYPRRDPQPTAC